MEVFSLSEATDIVERSQKHEKQIDDHQNIQHGSKLRTEESKNEWSCSTKTSIAILLPETSEQHRTPTTSTTTLINTYNYMNSYIVKR